MKKYLVVIIMLFICRDLIGQAINDSSGFVGKKIPSEKKTWIDDSTGCEITQWTSISTNYHPYFTVESFIDDQTAIIISGRTGKRQLYKLNLENGEMIQMTAASNYRNMDHLPQYKTIWYLDGKLLVSINTVTLKSEVIHDFSNFAYRIGSFSVTCDAKWFVFAVNKKEQTPSDLGYGPFAIYKLSLDDKKITQISLDYGFNIGHVQTNPVDPNLILFCWQWEKFGRPLLVGHSPIRTWWINIDGSDGGPFIQEFGTQRTHETWTSDGKSIAFVSKYRMGEKLGKHFLGLQSIDGKINYRYWEQVSPGHQNIFNDNKHWIVDCFDNDESLLALIRIDKDKVVNKKVLFRHGSSITGQDSHPHPRFSTNGTYVMFSTDKSGTPQVYTVKLNLSEKM